MSELPVNRKAEVGIIGACLDGGFETCVSAFDALPSKAFFYEDTRTLFECMKALVNRSALPDVAALADEWKRLGCTMLFPWQDMAGAQDQSPKFMLTQRAEIVLDHYQRRAAMIAGDALARAAGDLAVPLSESLGAYEMELAEAHSKVPPVLEPKPAAEALQEDLQRRFDLQGQRSGTVTGFPRLDDLTDGMQLGEFWVIGARPSVGKTAFALNLASHIALQMKIPVLFISLEMSALALLRRLLASTARINLSKIRRGSYAPEDFKRMTTFSARLSRSPLYIVDRPGGAPCGQLCNSIRAAVRRWGVKIVFLDYLQKVRPDSKGEKRTYEIGDSSAALVEVTKRENINLCALAQLNRDKDKQGRRPMVSDLADSKSIEADADFVGLLDRPVQGREYWAELIVAKQRDGARELIPLHFEGQYNLFTEDNEPREANDHQPV